MHYSFEEQLLVILNEIMPSAFYLNDVVTEMIKTDICDAMDENEVKNKVKKALYRYENLDGEEQLIQNLGSMNNQEEIYIKLFIENEQGYFIKEKPKLPNLFEKENIVINRDIIINDISKIEIKIKAIKEIITNNPSTYDWSSEHMENITKNLNFKREQLNFLNLLIDDIHTSTIK